MKKLVTLFLIVSAFQLTGCASALMKKENDNKSVSGYHIRISNDAKIRSKVVNLSFESSPGIDFGKFDLKDMENNIQNGLKEKGVVLSPSGQKVVVRINSFFLHGDNYNPNAKSYGTGVLNGIADAVGLGLAARVAGGLVENDMTNTMRTQNKTCDSSSCAPEVNFSIVSGSYETNVDMRALIVYSNYNYGMRLGLENAIQEFFEPK